MDDRAADAAALHLYEALGLQDPQRLTHRRGAHAELLQQALERWEPFAVLEFSQEDQFTDPSRDDIGEPMGLGGAFGERGRRWRMHN
ncbi:hypothetical protein GCM10011578_018600 [Streptomyces fuscichromogenes]|uniref:Uncharacterized protein n=1 Tax=Streptomyces fuscichromogenes TaxID=1324013 RepID=A0A918CQ20_9ACTN|nr:hypothetical protein GCM10011578_018600 [Streptomyces fuscichromogenes]